MASNTLLLLPLLFIVAAFISAIVFMAIWVYQDAKSLGLNASLWVLLTIAIPNFLGIIIYLVIRHDTKKKFQCPHCQRPVEVTSKYCPSCATPIDPLYTQPQPPNKNKNLLIVGVVCLVIAFITLFSFIIIGLLSFNNFSTSSTKNLSLMQVQNSSKDGYYISFQTKYGDSSKKFKLANDAQGFFHYDTTTDKGSVTISLENISKKTTTDVPRNHTGTLVITPGDQYKIILNAENGGGKYQFNWE